MLDNLTVKQLSKPDFFGGASPSKLIYGMRHGQTSLDVAKRCDGWVDLDLSDEGEQGVVATLSDYLQAIPFTQIVTPDFIRTQTTAHIVQSGLPSDPKIILNNDMKTWNIGTISGDKKTSDRKSFVKHLISHPEIHSPDGESYNEFIERFDDFIHKQMAAIESGKLKGPILDMFSGSCLRRLGELINDDRDSLDVKEAGLIMLYPDGDTWSAVLIANPDEEGNEIS
jgi:broad specificity phosphatase PhoE